MTTLNGKESPIYSLNESILAGLRIYPTDEKGRGIGFVKVFPGFVKEFLTSVCGTEFDSSNDLYHV
jgi:hypothetical protein